MTHWHETPWRSCDLRGEKNNNKKGGSLFMFKMPTTLPNLFTQGSKLLRSSNDSPQLIKAKTSLISVVAPLTGAPQERGGQAKPAIKRRLLTHITPRQVYFFPLWISKHFFCAEQKINTPVPKCKHQNSNMYLRKGSAVADLSVCTNPKCDQNPEYSCERKHG